MVDLLIRDDDDEPSFPADPFIALAGDLVIPGQSVTSEEERQLQPVLHSSTHATSSTSASPFVSQVRHRARRKSKDSGYHPLKASSEGPPDGVTRPQLEKLVSGLDSWSLDDEESFNDEEERSENSAAQVDDEKVVLVHQISPKDSLPGVALKYGISLTELRRINQLWTTDSIHLRNVLYVPVSNAHAQSYVLQTPDTPTPTIRRIPASRLAFFPPPNTKPATPQPPPLIELSTPPPSPPRRLHSRSRSKFDTLPPERHHARPATFYSTIRPSSPSHAQRALSSLFAAMPIASRLSLDSSRSGSDEGMEHELDDVGPKPETELEPPTPPAPPPPPPPSSAYPPPISSALRERRLREPSPPPLPSSSSSLRRGLDRRGFATTMVYSAPTLSSAPPAPRTVQLEPSPAMQLPILNRKERTRELDLIDL